MFVSVVLSPVAYPGSALVAKKKSLCMPEAIEGLLGEFLQEVSKERLLR